MGSKIILFLTIHIHQYNVILHMSNNVFLSAPDVLMQNSIDNDFCRTIQSAGLTTYLPSFSSKDEFLLKSEIHDTLQKCSSSVHSIGARYGEEIVTSEYGTISISEFLLHEVKKHQKNNSSFKIFIWQNTNVSNEIIEPKQTDFINEIRNNISSNTSFSNIGSAVQFVDDLRSSLEIKQVQEFDLKDLEVFFISNQLDEMESAEILDMLSDVVAAEHLQIIQDSDVDYSELCSQQIGKSKLAVVYFKESADWALPFAQQVWKKIGGATSKTPILLIGDEDPETNMNKKFKAPKVISLIMSGILIPLEVKVTYDKIKEGVLV